MIDNTVLTLITSFPFPHSPDIMPLWDDLANCICQNAAQRPGNQEILDQLQRNSVCTGAQCFETAGEAFGLTAAPNTVPNQSTLFFMMITFMMMVAMMLKLKKPTPSIQEKPGSSESHSNEPPPPPTVS